MPLALADVSLPDNVLSAAALHYDTLAGAYAFTHPRVLREPFHEHVVHRNMGRRIGDLIMDLWDEIGSAIDETWGTETEEWKEICVFENMMHVIARASNRVFVGLPLCRNEAYLKSMEAFASDVSLAIIFMRFVPRILEPFLGRLIGFPNNHHYRQSAALHLPLVKERLEKMAQKDADPSFKWDEPNDYLSWHIRLAQKEGNMVELEPEMISRRLMPINFGAIHTTVFTITNCLFDLLASSSCGDATRTPMETIREEALSEYQTCQGKWSKAAMSHLVYTDSAIRESMRVSGFVTRGLQRKVVAREGLEHKGLGLKLPFGSTVSVDAHGIMHDERLYGDPHVFDPFRFARQRERENAMTSSSGEELVRTALESKQLSCSSTSEKFLTFGHGRHACPGRFLVSHELKLLLAYASMHYEIEPLGSRPPNNWFGQHIIPPMKATIRIRRRGSESVGL
jgi:cytochrome P450